MEQTKSFVDYKICQKLVGLKHRCNDKDLEFNLTFSFLKRLLSRKTCEYTGIRFDDDENRLSIERINSDKGYTEDNVVAVAKRINEAKSNFTYNELKLTLKAIEKHQKLLEEQK